MQKKRSLSDKEHSQARSLTVLGHIHARAIRSSIRVGAQAEQECKQSKSKTSEVANPEPVAQSEQ